MVQHLVHPVNEHFLGNVKQSVQETDIPKSMYRLRQVLSEAQIQKILRWCMFGTTIHCPECKSWRVKVKIGLLLKVKCNDFG